MTRVSTLRVAANASLLAFLLLLTFIYTRARFLGPISFDEEFVIWGGWLMKQGCVPYRDFFEPKPPVIFFANYLGLVLFGFKDSLFRIVPTILALGSLGLFYLAMLKRKVIPWLATLLTAQVAIWLLGPDFHDSSLNDTESYGFAFTLIGFSLGSLSAAFNARGKTIALHLCSGICFALAIFSKELFVFSVVPAWLLAAHRPGHWEMRQLLFSAAGAVFIALGLLVYLSAHSALIPYFDLVRFYQTFAANYCVDIGHFPRVTGFSVLVASWKALHAALYNLKNLAFIVPLWICALFSFFRGGPAQRRIGPGIAFLAVLLGMVAVSVGHCFWAHYFLMGTMGLALLSLFGAETLSEFLAAKGVTASLVAFVLLSALLVYVGFAPTKQVLTKRATFQHVPWDPILHETIDKHSRPGDYILTTEGPLLYVVTNRQNPLPLNFFVDEILPYVTAQNRVLQMDLLRAQLEQNLPKVCYFPPWMRPRQNKYHELLFDPLLRKYNYIRVTDVIWYLPDDHASGD